jgi:hypothetical protein
MCAEITWKLEPIDQGASSLGDLGTLAGGKKHQAAGG